MASLSSWWRIQVLLEASLLTRITRDTRMIIEDGWVCEGFGELKAIDSGGIRVPFEGSDRLLRQPGDIRHHLGSWIEVLITVEAVIGRCGMLAFAAARAEVLKDAFGLG